MNRLFPLLLVASGCTAGDLSVTPSTLSWGEVDFQEERPDEGYGATEIVLRNEGTKTLSPEIADFDLLHLVLEASRLGEPLEEGQTLIIRVGVWDYDVAGGERDTEVNGRFDIIAEGLREPVPVQWSFTPVRHIVVDTGTFR